MKFSLEISQPTKSKADALILGIYSGESVKDVLHHLDAKIDKVFADQVENHLKTEGFKGKLHQFASTPGFGHLQSSRLIVIGLGEKASPKNIRKAAAVLYRKLNGADNDESSYVINLRPAKLQVSTGKKRKAAAEKSADTKYGEDEFLCALVEGWTLGSFNFDKYKTQNQNQNSGEDKKKKEKAPELKVCGLSLSAKDFAAAVKKGKTFGESTNLARTLIAEPAFYMTPTRLANEAKKVAKATGLTCTVMTEAQIEKLGMGALMGVARGADEPPRFIVLKYTAPKAKKQIAIVGKGITFDSGGLSLKTAVGMERMKYDMSGAAAVIGTMQVIGTLKPKVSVMGVIAATENMPSGKALHPGDVIQAMNGKTIEVNNTDAEGRLVLADALSYVCEEGVDEIIDLATLTGAIIHALGRVAAGVMGTSNELIKDLDKAAEEAGEKLWRLPLYEEFKPKLKSDIADLKNAGSGGEAGSCCAAMFLKEFVKPGIPWAHMDIAGVAWSDKESAEINKGGTGFGVRTLSRYILSR